MSAYNSGTQEGDDEQMLRKIVHFPNPVLRAKTEEVTVFDDELKNLISDMYETMEDADGCGLAAPQIGLSKRLAVIEYDGQKLTIINPEISNRVGSSVREEGCLSFPGIFEKVEAPDKITLTYKTETGEKITEDIEGFMARIVCHETDHLFGRMIIDRVPPLKRTLIKKRLARKD